MCTEGTSEEDVGEAKLTIQLSEQRVSCGLCLVSGTNKTKGKRWHFLSSGISAPGCQSLKDLATRSLI